VRDGDWKLIEWYEGRRALYNLAADLGETNNVIDEHPQIAADLQGKLDAWREEVEAIIPQPNPNYVPVDDPFADPRV